MSLESLKWQIAMGVDETIGDVAVAAQTHASAKQARPATTSAHEGSTPESTLSSAKPLSSSRSAAAQSGSESTTPTSPAPAAPHELEAKARTLADAATTRDELRAAIEQFDGLAIQKTAKNMVFSDGNPDADIMFIGEAPGANEDEQGIPFCGASGQLMDKAVAHIGLTRSENWYISNTLFWRPPGNRTPTKEEIAICRPFVEKHIALIQPKLLVLVGGTAANSLMDDNRGISRLRGTFKEYNNPYLSTPIHMTAIFHPSFLLRSPFKKKDFWFDLLALREFANQHQVTL